MNSNEKNERIQEKGGFIENIVSININNHKSKSRNSLETEKDIDLDNAILESQRDDNIRNIIEGFQLIEDSPHKKLIESIKKDEEFFIKNDYILTEGSCERLAKLIHYIECKNPVLLEGPTGASKTFTVKIAFEYLK